MKKNVVGTILASKEPPKKRWQRWHLPARLLCLLLALFLWLIVTNATSAEPKETPPSTAAEVCETV